MVVISRQVSSGPLYCDGKQFPENTEYLQVRSESGVLGIDIPVDVSANVFQKLISYIQSESDSTSEEFITSLEYDDFSYTAERNFLSEYQECPFFSTMYTESTNAVDTSASYVFSDELVYPETVTAQMCESCITSVLDSIIELYSEEKIVLYLRS